MLITWDTKRVVFEGVNLIRVCVMCCFAALLLSSCAPDLSHKRLGSLDIGLNFDELEQSLPRLAEVRSSVRSLTGHPHDVGIITEQLNLFAEVFH